MINATVAEKVFGELDGAVITLGRGNLEMQWVPKHG